MDDLTNDPGDPNEIREDVGIAPEVEVPEEVEENLRKERGDADDDDETVDGD